MIEKIQIIPFSEEYSAAFKQLNIEWLEHYFHVEEYDELVLSNPQQYIIDKGGKIFLAALENDKGHEIIGTAALMLNERGETELTKMSVTRQLQGKKIGRRLAERAIEEYKQSPSPLLFLESNSRLEPAIKLYESLGFEHKTKPSNDSHYARADVYMEYVKA